MNNDLVKRAMDYARSKHKGQIYGDEPFIVHPLEVFEIIKMLHPIDYNLQAAALLHDVVEDTNTTYEDIVREFGEDIAILVHEVTKEKPDPQIAAIFPRLKSQRGIILKYADRLSNLSHMELWDKDKKDWYLKSSKFWKA